MCARPYSPGDLPHRAHTQRTAPQHPRSSPCHTFRASRPARRCNSPDLALARAAQQTPCLRPLLMTWLLRRERTDGCLVETKQMLNPLAVARERGSWIRPGDRNIGSAMDLAQFGLHRRRVVQVRQRCIRGTLPRARSPSSLSPRRYSGWCELWAEHRRQPDVATADKLGGSVEADLTDELHIPIWSKLRPGVVSRTVRGASPRHRIERHLRRNL